MASFFEVWLVPGSSAPPHCDPPTSNQTTGITRGHLHLLHLQHPPPQPWLPPQSVPSRGPGIDGRPCVYHGEGSFLLVSAWPFHPFPIHAFSHSATPSRLTSPAANSLTRPRPPRQHVLGIPPRRHHGLRTLAPHRQVPPIDALLRGAHHAPVAPVAAVRPAGTALAGRAAHRRRPAGPHPLAGCAG